MEDVGSVAVFDWVLVFKLFFVVDGRHCIDWVCRILAFGEFGEARGLERLKKRYS